MWLLLVPILAYLAILAFLYFSQTAMLFPIGQVAPAGPLPAGAERVSVTAASGERLIGLHIPPTAPPSERLLVLGFGGNAWNGDAMATYLHDLYPQAQVVAFHYRGYRPSEGTPAAAALRADALRIHDFVRERLGPARVVAVGFSVGSGVASALAAQRPLDGLILVTPFDSLGRVAAGQYPWLPVRLLFRHDLDPAEDLAEQQVPVAIIGAERDALVVPARTDALRRAVPNLVFDRTIVGVGHNDIYDRTAFRDEMKDALSRVLGRSRD